MVKIESLKSYIEILNEDGRRTVYGHLSEILVKEGDTVKILEWEFEWYN